MAGFGGKCSACGVSAAQRTNDFLCERCVNLKGGMIVCRLCYTRDPVPLAKLRENSANGLPIPARAGVVIVITCEGCEETCRKQGIAFSTTAEVYTTPLH